MLAVVIDLKLMREVRKLVKRYGRNLQSLRIAMVSIAIGYALMRMWMRSLKSIFNTTQLKDLRVKGRTTASTYIIA